MKKSTLKIFIFCGLFITICFLLHHILVIGLRLRKTENFGVWNKINNGQVNADIVFAGSSRTLFHFNSEAIGAVLGTDRVFNIGIDGGRLDVQLARLKFYLKHNSKPKVIVQGLDIISLENRVGIFDSKQYLPYLEEDIYHELLLIDPQFWRKRYIPLYAFAVHGMELTKESIKGYLEYFGLWKRKDLYINGYRPQDMSWTDDFEKFKEEYPQGKSYAIQDVAIENLVKIIQLAKDNDIRIILVYTPEYYENYALTLNRDEIFSIYRKISAKLNVPFWDYSDDPITRDRDSFYNSQHLTTDGATVFSTDFASRLNEYLIEKDIKIQNE